MSEAGVFEGLSKSKLAVELNDDERRTLARAMTLRDLKHGEVLIREGLGRRSPLRRGERRARRREGRRTRRPRSR